MAVAGSLSICQLLGSNALVVLLLDLFVCLLFFFCFFFFFFLINFNEYLNLVDLTSYNSLAYCLEPTQHLTYELSIT